jgi:hypothetical protein
LPFNGLHSVISQKIVLFITTAVRTSNPIYYILFSTDLMYSYAIQTYWVTAFREHKFTSNMDLLSSAVRGEMAVLYPIEVPPKANLLPP